MTLGLPALAFLLLAAGPAAAGTRAEVAGLAIPFPVPGEPHAAPSLLSAADVERYRQIFTLQQAGGVADADRAIAELEDRRLIGYVLQQRYLHPAAGQASFAELRDWLDAYADLAGAEAIHALALQRRPHGAAAPRAPVVPALRRGTIERFGVPQCDYHRTHQPDDALEDRIAQYLRDRVPGQALAHIAARRGAMDTVAFDRARAHVAAGYFYGGDWSTALDLALASAGSAGGQAPQAFWIAGLVHWRQGDYRSAAQDFARMARAECASPWGRAGGAYWAHRAHLRDRNPGESSRWLHEAAGHSHTFYGLLANRVLGIDVRFDFDAPALTQAHLAALAAQPATRRVLGLLQLGRTDLAERELLRVDARDGDSLFQEGLVALAQTARLPRAALTHAATVQPAADRYYDGALYPLLGQEPPGGFRVDPALVHAVIRQESRFDPAAVSRAGAMGLMQLMPGTASHVAGLSYRGANAAQLHDPDLNLRLGQDFLLELLGRASVDNNLIRLLAAYNAGPGNLERWLGEIDDGNDPLLFLESMPYGETRAYVERVLAGYWIYRLRLGQPVPSLDAIAAGAAPRYIPVTEQPVQRQGPAQRQGEVASLEQD